MLTVTIDVEHAAGQPAPGVPPLPQLQYEGFEPSPFKPDDSRAELEDLKPVCVLLIAILDATHSRQLLEPASGGSPIFDLGRVQYALPAPLLSFVVCSDMLAMGLASGVIILIELQHSDKVIRVPIPRKPADMTIHKIFMDPSGSHIIVTSAQGENWYMYRQWKKPRQLKGFKMVIESIAWNKVALLSASHMTPTQRASTREILIGTRNGTIHEAVLNAEEDFFKPLERYSQLVFTLPERHSVTGIKFDFFPPSDPQRVLVIVTTPSRIYQFVGSLDRRTEEGDRFTKLFASYRDTAPSSYIYY